MRAAVVLGTRPEIIKMSPIVRELQRRQLDFFILHTGQHYSYEMDRVFFDELSLPSAKYNLDVGSGSQAEQTSRILVGVEMVLLEEKPDVVLVEGEIVAASENPAEAYRAAAEKHPSKKVIVTYIPTEESLIL